MTEPNKLTNVHEAMMDAVHESKTPTLVSYTFKSNPEHNQMAEQICARNGTNLPTFLRKCVEGLIKDYLP